MDRRAPFLALLVGCSGEHQVITCTAAVVEEVGPADRTLLGFSALDLVPLLHGTWAGSWTTASGEVEAAVLVVEPSPPASVRVVDVTSSHSRCISGRVVTAAFPVHAELGAELVADGHLEVVARAVDPMELFVRGPLTLTTFTGSPAAEGEQMAVDGACPDRAWTLDVSNQWEDRAWGTGPRLSVNLSSCNGGGLLEWTADAP